MTEIFKSKRGEGRGLGRANLVLDAGECALGARRVAHGTLQEACARGAEEGGRHLAWELRGRERPSWKRHHTTSTATRPASNGLLGVAGVVAPQSRSYIDERLRSKVLY